jgi:hypothetical protein
VPRFNSKLIRYGLALATLLASLWPSGVCANVGNDHCSQAVVHDSRQPSQCPALRATEFFRLIVTVKSATAGCFAESIPVAFGARQMESIFRAVQVAPSSTLQSRSVRLQV